MRAIIASLRETTKHGRTIGVKMENQPRIRRPNWNDSADMYSSFSFCELEDTRTYLSMLQIKPGETFLDVCCGPGRASVVAAEMGAIVTGVDSAEKMLEHAKVNAEAHGVAGKCNFRLQDWDHVLPGQNLQKHDVVFASRCGAIMQVEKLSKLANRVVGVQIFANAPAIPNLLGVLFSGCGDGGFGGPGGPARASALEGRSAGSEGPGGPGNDPAGQGGPGGPRADGPEAKKAIYLTIAEKVFEAGYEPNVRCFPERFRKTFVDEAAAIEWVATLKYDFDESYLDHLRLNVAPFLTPVEGGVEFCIATRAAIIWWEV